MSKDLEIIKELEKKIGERLDRRYSIDENENIIILDLSGLKISDILCLKDLKNLTELNLSNNQISNITSIKDLQNIKHLDLSNNKVYQLPIEIFDLKLDMEWEYSGYGYLLLNGNPVERPQVL